MPLNKDYQNFVARMGSFEDDADELLGEDGAPEKVLEHHGILGMHWGIHRRASSTSSGSDPKKLSRVKAYVDGSANIAKEAKNIHTSVSNIKAVKKIPSSESMTDAQLKERVSRMNLEQQYANLTANQTSKGREYVHSTLEVAGSALAITSSALGIALAIKQLKG